MGWIALAVYIIVIPVWVWMEKKFFPYQEGGYHIEWDGVHEITPEVWKCDVLARAAIWPFCVAIVVILIPIKLLDDLFEIL